MFNFSRYLLLRNNVIFCSTYTCAKTCRKRELIFQFEHEVFKTWCYNVMYYVVYKLFIKFQLFLSKWNFVLRCFLLAPPPSPTLLRTDVFCIASRATFYIKVAANSQLYSATHFTIIINNKSYLIMKTFSSFLIFHLFFHYEKFIIVVHWDKDL